MEQLGEDVELVEAVFGGSVDVAADGGEVLGTGWQRPLTRTLPAGNQWTYAHYGGTETRDNPCTTANDPALQAGLLKTRTGPTAADPSTRIDETVYDSGGRTVATRISSGPWTCTSYDDRGRPAERKVPAFGGAPARTITWDWAVGGTAAPNDGDPTQSSVSDPAGDIGVAVDLLGRPITQTDVWGSEVVTNYDRAGRATGTETTAGGISWETDVTLNVDGAPTSMDVDGARIADVAYDSNGRPSTVTYPSGPGTAGNGTSSAPMGYDAQGRPISLTWKAADGTTMTSDAVTYDTEGRIIDQTIDGTDATPTGPTFAYDAAGRLTMAELAVRNATTGVPTGTNRTLEYLFAGTGGCGASTATGKNTNRTAARIDGTTTAQYCYDNADRLTSTTQSGYGASIAYDAHGNTTSMAGETRRYDGDDRHRETTNGTTTVTYVRDALDRTVERKVDDTVVTRYAFAGPGDSPVATLDGTGTLNQRTVRLPGGALYTDNGAGLSETWSYPNLHGDIAALADSTGAKQGPTRTYDPYGNHETTLVDTAPSNFDWAWLGAHQRPLEHEGTLKPTIEMGTRQYDLVLGRFLQVDSVEGGSANDYDYANGDPRNGFDLDGTCGRFGNPWVPCGLSTRKGQWHTTTIGRGRCWGKGITWCNAKVQRRWRTLTKVYGPFRRTYREYEYKTTKVFTVCYGYCVNKTTGRWVNYGNVTHVRWYHNGRSVSRRYFDREMRRWWCRHAWC